MIESISLQFGRAPGVQGEPIDLVPVTVFIGPNNSGKSKVLSEIHQYCETGKKNTTDVILESITFTKVSHDVAESLISKITLSSLPNEGLANALNLLVGARGQVQRVNSLSLRNLISNPSRNIEGFCKNYLRHSLLMLDGKSRIDLVKEKAAGDLQGPPHNSLQVLFRDDDKRHEVRRIVETAFGSYFVLDPTKLGQIRIRLSSREPVSEREERGIDTEAVKFHASAQPIELFSDGVKAFTGIITEVIAGDPKIVLIDEPEAFLHPALASMLGKELASAASTSDKNILVSTHSPAFLMGCIQSGSPVNIVRLTYRSGVATARVLPSQEILELMRNPLLRSTGVLTGLFYEFVIVTESDADRAFYQEINERLLRFKPDWGIPNCLFINAQNKQTIHTIIRPLRRLGIPAAGIVDIDVLKDGGRDWTSLLSGAYIPTISYQSLGSIRHALNQAMNDTDLNMKRDGGVDILDTSDREAALNLLSQLADYGIFVVPGGELESWLQPLGSSGHGPHWLIKIFELMGEDPDAEGYIKPTDNDVWKFISAIKAWLVNPNRKGIPG